MNKTTFDTRMDEFLIWVEANRDTVPRNWDESVKPELERQLRTLVNDVCMEVIGEDEKHPAGTGRFEMLERIAKNELRATQRTKLATILGENG